MAKKCKTYKTNIAASEKNLLLCGLQPAHASYHQANQGTGEQLHAHVQQLCGQWRTRPVHRMQSINEDRLRNLRLENG